MLLVGIALRTASSLTKATLHSHAKPLVYPRDPQSLFPTSPGPPDLLRGGRVSGDLPCAEVPKPQFRGLTCISQSHLLSPPPAHHQARSLLPPPRVKGDSESRGMLFTPALRHSCRR